jgi:hypothetical protein
MYLDYTLRALRRSFQKRTINHGMIRRMEFRYMDEKITIIEGPPPTFESVNDAWASGVTDSSTLTDIVITRLRTFNGPGLVERCYRAWREQNNIYLEYRSSDGLKETAPIVAARTLEVDDGQMLLLWLRMSNQDVELELGYDDDQSDDLDDDFGLTK